MRASKRSRPLLAAAFAATAVAVAAPLAAADAVYHSQHIALNPTGGASLRSGFVENIHADGPQVYAHELYVLNGAEPDTTYQVTLLLYPFDPAASRARLRSRRRASRPTLLATVSASSSSTPRMSRRR